MINIIYKMMTAIGPQQGKDNNNIAIKYLESNKDDILDLAEKHYKNIVDVFTNSVINTAVYSSSDSTLSLLQSIFPNHRIKVIFGYSSDSN